MRLFGLIGYPLNYTLSPLIHGYVFRRLNIDAAYVPFRLTSKRLPHFVEFSRDSLDGFNVTIPHKVAVARLIDELSDEARTISSVNTVINRGQRLIGYNTDYLAIRDSLLARGYGGEEALLIGAGGAARAAVLALSRLNCRAIRILNRTRERAMELCKLANGLGLDCSVVEPGGDYGKPYLLINATPISNENYWSLSIRGLGVSLILDMAYEATGDTELVRVGRELGLSVIDGIEILVRQALEADKLWLGEFSEPNPNEVIEFIKNQRKDNQ